MKNLDRLAGSFFILMAAFSFFVWGEQPGGGKLPTEVPPAPSPTPTAWVIAGDPTGDSGYQVNTPADHVGPALHITQASPEKRLVLQPGSRLWVGGSTTGQSFGLGARLLLGSAILKVPLGPQGMLEAVKEGGIQALTLVVPLEYLRSSDRGMDRNFFRALKGKDNPNVQLRLEEEVLSEKDNTGAYPLKGSAKCTIAGVTRDVGWAAHATFTGDSVRVQGVRRFSLNEFDVKPFSFLAGVARPGNPVDIYYDLLFGPEKPGTPPSK